MSKPAIRGMQGDRIVIMNNGVRQEGQQWGSEHAPEVDPYLASRLTVIKGASSVRYGANAMGGVVLVEPWPLPTAPGMAGEAHLARSCYAQGGGKIHFLQARIVEPITWRGGIAALSGGTLQPPSQTRKVTEAALQSGRGGSQPIV